MDSAALFSLSDIDYAYNKTAWQSSDHDEMSKASKAVDGSDFTMAQTGTEPWPLLVVDITRAIHIAEIWVTDDGKRMSQHMIISNLHSCIKATK